MSNEALKPCPFCGGGMFVVALKSEDETGENGGALFESWYRTGCEVCAYLLTGARTCGEAIVQANCRAPASLAQRSDDSPSALSEEEREFVREMTDEAAETPSQWAPDISSHDLGRLLAIISRLTSGGSDDRHSGGAALSEEEVLGVFEDHDVGEALREWAISYMAQSARRTADIRRLAASLARRLNRLLTSRSLATAPAGDVLTEEERGDLDWATWMRDAAQRAVDNPHSREKRSDCVAEVARWNRVIARLSGRESA